MAVLGGCASVPPPVHPHPVSQAAYAPLLEAAPQVLRDFGFRSDRVDHRFGQVGTFPLGSPTFLEPWKGQNTTVGQAMEASLHDLRRTARVTLEPHDGVTDDATADSAEYQLRVEVLLERRQVATRRLVSAHGGRVFADLSAVPAEYAARGMQAHTWVPIGRDLLLESRLLTALLDRAGEMPKAMPSADALAP